VYQAWLHWNDRGQDRCREGYQGIRCDQFLPKTDSILADPKSKEVYKRQVLSITSIAMAISLLGTLCMALYCRNKDGTANEDAGKARSQAHIKENRVLRNYNGRAANPLRALDPKARTLAADMPMHK
ncbi:hypothetical protein NHX12_022574, partial [Muraenolepis orangiensis]